MPLPTLGDALLAGLTSFWSPCVLQIVPFYLALLLGLAAARTPRPARLTGAFALGFAAVVLLTCLGATPPGRAFAALRDWLTWGAAGMLALTGAAFLLGHTRPTTGWAGLVGASFAFGWIACAGPTLSAILYAANRPGMLVQGGGLLVVHTLALVVPFAAAGLLVGHLGRALPARWRRPLMVLAAAALILLAVLIATDRVQAISLWLQNLIDWRLTLR